MFTPQMPESFIALDVETANADVASICSIGLVHFKGGEIARKLPILVNPEDYFDPVNVSIHGIREEDVASAKTMQELFPAIASALGSITAVHHTPFDRVALCRTAANHGFPELTCQWLDSARVARRAWDRYSRRGYGLANLAQEFGIQFRHHDACEDARAAGLILLRAISETGISLDQWMERAYRPFSLRDRIARSGNPEGHLAGETVVFTGQLSMPRHEAAELAAAAGMEVGDRVTKQTSVLVVGDRDLRRLRGHEKSSKHRRAEQLIVEGAELKIIGESDFKVMVAADLNGLSHQKETDPRSRAPRVKNDLVWVAQSREPSRISLLAEAITIAKREKRLDEACKLLSEEIESQEAESQRTGLGVAPWYYEQLAIIFRNQGRHTDELATLERYDRLIKAPGATPAALKARLEKVRATLSSD